MRLIEALKDADSQTIGDLEKLILVLVIVRRHGGVSTFRRTEIGEGLGKHADHSALERSISPTSSRMLGRQVSASSV